MGKVIDLMGHQFGRLTVIKRVDNANDGHARWLCRCACRKITIVRSNNLRNGTTRSCGCLAIDNTKQRSVIHGYARKNKSKIYQIWRSMINRCTNINSKDYKNYGARGIRVCKRWFKFENFLTDMGERPDNMTLDRVDNNGNYCKENCRWATIKQQHRNMRSNIFFTINSETKCLKEWCEIRNLKYSTVSMRINQYGWNIEEALEFIPRNKGRKS